MSLSVPISWGELLDKISILQIKTERMTNVEKRKNVEHELALLVSVRNREIRQSTSLEDMVCALRQVNERLWDIEDAIRVCEQSQDFGPGFVELARAVYRTNDQRAALKYRINILLGSPVIEEKSYASYQNGN